MKKVILLLFFACCAVASASAQDFAVKTNALYWATTTPNLGFEVGLGRRTTLDLTGGYNPWTLNRDNNKKWKHWMVMPEFRYWLCERFNGHFFGLHSGYMRRAVPTGPITAIRTYIRCSCTRMSTAPDSAKRRT